MEDFDAEIDALSKAVVDNSLLMVELDKALAGCTDGLQVLALAEKIRLRIVQEFETRGDFWDEGA
jgi:hypothetical protein